MTVTSDPWVSELIRSVGAYYRWGAGTLGDGPKRWPQGPFDCSGYVQAAWLAMGIIRPNAWDDPRTAYVEDDTGSLGLANACDPLPGSLAEQIKAARVGDLAYYPGHVMLCIGDGMCIGASGGDSETKSNTNRGRVQVVPIDYRRDIVVVGRLKDEYRA